MVCDRVDSRCTFILNIVQFWSPSSYLPKDTGKENGGGGGNTHRKMMRMMSKEQLPYCMMKGGIKLCEITNGMEKVNRESLFIVSANGRIRGQVKLTEVKLKPNKSRWFFKCSKLKTLYYRVL